MVRLHVFLAAAVDGVGWSASRPSRFTPGGKSAGYSLNGMLGVDSASSRISRSSSLFEVLITFVVLYG